MADLELEQDDERERVFERAARILKEALKEGENAIAEWEDGTLHVYASESASSVRRKFPNLYGYLASVEAQLEGGLAGFFVFLLIATGICLTLYLEGVDRFLPEGMAAQLRAWGWGFGSYVSTFVVFFFIWVYLSDFTETQTYRRRKKELLQKASTVSLDRDLLVSLLSEANEFPRTLRQLKLDPAPTIE